MPKIKIVTDSSVTLSRDLAKSLGITIVPLSVMIDGKTYSDDDFTEEGAFLALMKASSSLPKTSQPPIGVFAETYTNLSSDAETEIISIHLTHSLSGTLDAAHQGALLSGQSVTVVDSAFTDQAMAFQVIEAAKMAKEGLSKDAILEKLALIREKTELYIGVSTLENLVKGGRIGRVTGLLTSLLNIKVIMQLENHLLKPILKGRGQKTFTNWLETFKTTLEGKELQEIAISYSGKATFAQELKATLQPLVAQEISVYETGSVIQTHAGEDAFAVMVRHA